LNDGTKVVANAPLEKVDALFLYLKKQTNKTKVPTKLITSNVSSFAKFDASMALVNSCSPWVLLVTN
jgi:hypothetical protein